MPESTARPPQHPEPSQTGRSTPSAEGAAPHLVHPDFARFALPFRHRVERLLFQQPAIVILVAGLLNQAIHLWIDPLFCLVTVLLAVSSYMFKLWMRGIPVMLQQLHARCLKEQHSHFLELTGKAYDQFTGRRRFVPIGIGLAVAIAFVGFTLARAPSVRSLLAWSLSMLPWAWMIGSAGAVALGIARLVRAVGEADVLHILPEHPDGCGGLKSVGTFFARMVSPVLVVAVLLGFASVDPQLTRDQAALFHMRPLQSLLGTTLSSEEKEAAEDKQLELELRTEVGHARVEHLKKECAKLEVLPGSGVYAECISRLVAESNAISEAYSAGHQRIWNSRIVPFARVGLLILIACIGLCFIWPLGSVHLSMLKARDRQGLELARSLEEAERHFREKLKEQELHEASEASEYLERVRKQVLRVRHYPVWPFDAASVSKVAIPQVLALGSTLAGFLVDWMSR